MKIRVRQCLYEILEGSARSTAVGRAVNTVLAILIVANVAGVMLETVREFAFAYQHILFRFEVFSVLVFSLEYLLRVWCCVENEALGSTPWRRRWKYVRSPFAMIDLLAIAPFYLGAFVNVDTRVLRAFRLLRIFKLARHSASMDLLLTILRREAGAFVSIVTVILVVVVLAATGVYFLERDTQVVDFSSIPHSMWWAAITLTTVGYGDVVPQTLFGRIFGIAITFAGVGLVALPAGLLASSFSEELAARRARYLRQLTEAKADGEVTEEEQLELTAARINLGLTVDEAALIEESDANLVCPHCGNPVLGRGKQESMQPVSTATSAGDEDS